MARILGAPVTEPQGNSARKISATPASLRFLRRDGGDHGVQGGIGLDLEQVLTSTLPASRDAAEIVADQIHDHQIFGAVLGAGRQRGAFAVIVPARAPRVPFIGRTVIRPSAGEIEEQFRRQAENLRAPHHRQRRNAPRRFAPRSCSYRASGSPAKAKRARKLRLA